MRTDRIVPVVITQETSRRMAVMSFICVCMIVAIHCTPRPPLNSWQWWAVNLLGGDGFCRIAVPWFFVASGFFLAGHFDEDRWYGREVLKRVKTLLIPFVLWALIGILFAWCMWYGIQKVGYVCDVHSPFENGVCMGIVQALGFNMARMNIGPIWYLRMLFILVVLSPLFYWCIRRSGYLLPMMAFVGYGIYDVVVHFTDFWEYVFSLRGLAYFMVGIAIRMGMLKCVVGDILLRYFVLIVGLGALILNAFARGSGLVFVENATDFLMVPLLMFGAWMVMSGMKIPMLLVRQSFAIYVLHGLFIQVFIALAVALRFRGAMDMSLMMAVMRLAFAVFGSIAMSILVKRVASPLASVLFGGR